MSIAHFELLAIVESPREKRVRCQYNECSHPTYKAVHIVKFPDGSIKCVGSSCYSILQREQASLKNVKPTFGDRTSSRLTEEERALLISNTEELIERFRTAALETKTFPKGRIEPRKSDKVLRDRAHEIAREKFLDKGINPDLAGWKGWFETEVKEIYERLKKEY
ncbi:hypothetical protein V8Z77_01195 [Stutzerimonas stutzeri]|uniref:hypothetical protein n=1 Tax=Stutzerimonas stutzeri TaxID=316 RepID=UPI0031D52608